MQYWMALFYFCTGWVANAYLSAPYFYPVLSPSLRRNDRHTQVNCIVQKTSPDKIAIRNTSWAEYKVPINATAITNDIPNVYNVGNLTHLTMPTQRPLTTDNNKGTKKCPAGIVALTYASHPGKDDRFCKHVESALRNNVTLEILGWGTRWAGLTQKLQGALKAIERLPANCVVVFVDAYDVLWTKSLAAILSEFRAMHRPLVFAAECGCWPHWIEDAKMGFPKGTICVEKYPWSDKGSPYRYLNSGMWIGEVGYAKSLLSHLTRKSKLDENDQKLVADAYMRGELNISLDTRSRIFQCMHSTRREEPSPGLIFHACDPHNDIDFVNETWVNKRFGTKPALFHFNGGGKRHHIEMYNRMGWETGYETNTKWSWGGVTKSVRSICKKPEP